LSIFQLFYISIAFFSYFERNSIFICVYGKKPLIYLIFVQENIIYAGCFICQLFNLVSISIYSIHTWSRSKFCNLKILKLFDPESLFCFPFLQIERNPFQERSKNTPFTTQDLKQFQSQNQQNL